MCIGRIIIPQPIWLIHRLRQKLSQVASRSVWHPAANQIFIEAIGIRAGIKQYGEGTREWLMVECDGIPYNMLFISNVWRCSECLKFYYGLPNFQEHKCYSLQTVDPKREFRWLIPVSGLLHLEMNVDRSFTKLNWEVFMSSIGNVLGLNHQKLRSIFVKGRTIISYGIF